MATDAGELILKVSADISAMKAGLQDAANATKSLGASTVSTGIIIADVFESMGRSIVQFVTESISAFAEHEQTIARLNLLVGRDATEAFESFANELQRTTAFSDDAVLSLEQQLAQYGILPGSIRPATQALIDFSAVTGIDLPRAGQMLAQAMAGQSRLLKQYGIDVSTVGTRSENLATVTAALEGKFQSAAQQMKGTTLGAVESLTNRFEDLKKRIGEDLLPVAKKLLEWANDFLTPIELLINSNKKYNDTLEDQKAKLAQIVAQDKVQISNGVELTKQQKDIITNLVAHIAALKKKTEAQHQDTGATDREIAAIRSLKDEISRLEQEQQHLGDITQLTITKNILAAQMELEQLKANQVAQTQMTELETQKRLLTSQASWEANASFSDQLKVKVHDDLEKSTSDWVNMAGSMLNSFSESTAKMIVEGGRFRDVMKDLWKQLAEQVIAQITRMIAEWMVYMALTGGSGGFGFGSAASFFNGGHAAEGGMINEPSMVLGLKSGTRILAGEAGPEAIVPTGSANKVGLPGGGGGGGGGDVHVHINGQFLEGNPAKWQRLVQEQIIPQLRRFAMKSPNGLITRTRGALS